MRWRASPLKRPVLDWGKAPGKASCDWLALQISKGPAVTIKDASQNQAFGKKLFQNPESDRPRLSIPDYRGALAV
jgi:hypothetical protein